MGIGIAKRAILVAIDHRAVWVVLAGVTGSLESGQTAIALRFAGCEPWARRRGIPIQTVGQSVRSSRLRPESLRLALR